MSNLFERYRLRSQSKREKKLSEVFPFKMVLPGLKEELYSLPSPFTLNAIALFDSKSRKEAESYQSNLSKKFLGKKVEISSDEPIHEVIRVLIKKRFLDKEDLNSFLYFLTEDRNLHLGSFAFDLLPYDKNNNPIKEMEIYLGDPKGRDLTDSPSLKIPLPKKKIVGETTYFPPELYSIKKRVLEILEFTDPRNEPLKTVMAEAKNRYLAYKPLVQAGIEASQRWRIRDIAEPELWSKVLVEKESQIERAITEHDAFALYAKLSQDFKTEQGIIELQSRYVQESESDTVSYDYQVSVFRTLIRAYRDWGIPIRTSLSGKDSYRIISEIDVPDILENLDAIYKKYPKILGEASRGPVKGIEDKFKLLFRVLSQAAFLYVWNIRRKYEEPKITLDSHNIEYGYVLLDTPHTVNIITGAPKMLLRMNELFKVEGEWLTAREILERNFPDYKRWEEPFTIMLSTPILENEAFPTSKVEFLVECNAINAIRKIREMSSDLEKQRERKLISENLIYVFDRIPRKQFEDLNTLPEYQFREKYKSKS